MTGTPSVFTLEAANAMVPRLNALMVQQMARRAAFEEGLEKLSKLLGGTPATLKIFDGDTAPVRDLKAELEARQTEWQAAWNELEATGVVVKDQRTGLVDFYGQVDGRFVWLCWRYGEDAVTHYHPLNEGFAARKPIETTTRMRHLN